MNRATQLTLTLVAALIAVVVVFAATSGSSRMPAEATAAPAATTPKGIDPNDPAMVFNDDDPCVTPCSKLNVVYGSATSKLNPGAPAQSLSLDLYRSAKTPKRNAPVVVLLHGGGFVEGSRLNMRVAAEVLANAGFLVASAQYRLVPKDRNGGAGIAKITDILPAAEEATEDTQRAMRYIRNHARALGATTDRSRYAVGGYSAGAITAMRVALRGGDRSTPASRRWKVGAAFSISGFECGVWTKQYGCNGAYDESDPPILVFHGDSDTIVDFSWGSETCTNAILRGGGCKGYFYPDQDHFWSSGTIFGGAKNLNAKHPAVIPTVITFLRKALA